MEIKSIPSNYAIQLFHMGFSLGTVGETQTLFSGLQLTLAVVDL